jgi:hypothetical protein
VYLVGGDAEHEGSFIEDVAFDDQAAKHFVVRSTKALIKTDWSMSYYQPLYRSAADMAAFLNQSRISLVVVQEGLARPDLQMLSAAAVQAAWSPVPAPSGTLAWRRTTPLPPGEVRVSVDMRDKLGKYLSAGP